MNAPIAPFSVTQALLEGGNEEFGYSISTERTAERAGLAGLDCVVWLGLDVATDDGEGAESPDDRGFGHLSGEASPDRSRNPRMTGDMVSRFENTDTFREGRYFDITDKDGVYYIAQSFRDAAEHPYVLEPSPQPGPRRERRLDIRRGPRG